MTGTFAEAHSSHARRLTAELRRHAWQSGWPAGVSRHLHVTHEDGEYFVHYPQHAADRIHDLEFGTTSQAPSSVIHRFMNRIDQHSEHLDKRMAPMFEQLGLF